MGREGESGVRRYNISVYCSLTTNGSSDLSVFRDCPNLELVPRVFSLLLSGKNLVTAGHVALLTKEREWEGGWIRLNFINSLGKVRIQTIFPLLVPLVLTNLICMSPFLDFFFVLFKFWENM